MALPTPGLRTSKHHRVSLSLTINLLLGCVHWNIIFSLALTTPGSRSSKHLLCSLTLSIDLWLGCVYRNITYQHFGGIDDSWIAFTSCGIDNHPSVGLHSSKHSHQRFFDTDNSWTASIETPSLLFPWHWQLTFGWGAFIEPSSTIHLPTDGSLALTSPVLRLSKHYLVSSTLTIHPWTWLYHRRVNTPTWHYEWYR